MSAPTPGRNDVCPCGSGRKYKHCCITARSTEDSARLRLRSAEGRVVDGLLRFIADTWDEGLMIHAWDDFWNYDDVPDDLHATPEFDPMFIPFLVLWFVPDADGEDADPEWPEQPIGLHWLATMDEEVPDLDRTYIETACRSPLSAVVIEGVDPGRSLDLKDVLTGKRFHVLEAGASQRLQPADLLFTRVVTIDEVSIMFGAAPFIIPPNWHTRIIDWREQIVPKGLMTRSDLEDFDIEIRDLYFDIAAEILHPTPPQLCNTDGDPLALTSLTFDVKVAPGDALTRLLPLARVNGAEHVSEVTHDDSGALSTAVLSWVKAGNRKHKTWDNTVLGTMRIEPGRLVVDVNSARRAERLTREVKKHLGADAVLVDTRVVDHVEAVAERARQRAAGELEAAPIPEQSDELRAIEEEVQRRHWEAWIDVRVPALNNKTPRQAARTAVGRERLEALLGAFERTTASGPPGVAAHLARVRSALALTRPLT